MGREQGVGVHLVSGNTLFLNLVKFAELYRDGLGNVSLLYFTLKRQQTGSVPSLSRGDGICRQ